MLRLNRITAGCKGIPVMPMVEKHCTGHPQWIGVSIERLVKEHFTCGRKKKFLWLQLGSHSTTDVSVQLDSVSLFGKVEYNLFRS